MSDFGQLMSDLMQNGDFWRFSHGLEPLKFQFFAVILTLPRGRMLLRNNRRAII